MIFEMKPDYTKHARDVIAERGIHLAWVEATLREPQLREPDPNDPMVERFYRRIPDYGNRVLRVAVNTQVAPWRIVSVFFDRTMKGKL